MTGAKELLLTPEKEHKLRIEWRKLNPDARISWRDYLLTAQAKAGREGGFDEGVKKTTDAMDSTFSALLEEAKRKEKFRIIRWGGEPCPHGYLSPDTSKASRHECPECWQALRRR